MKSTKNQVKSIQFFVSSKYVQRVMEDLGGRNTLCYS